ncbi:MAG: DUF402 domain-containing protein [Gemmatimonadota bacterium]|nr:DUF402 domain-containing protein [Gemmatimonadota bacterium]
MVARGPRTTVTAAGERRMGRESTVADPWPSVRVHYHRPDRGTTVFDELLVLDRPEVKVTLLADYRGEDAHADGRRILSAGAPVVWFVFPDLCRDVGRFHLSDGTFTGWYTNLRAPIRMDGGDWYCTDLFLDHWLPATGGAGTWLDEDELAAARGAGLLEEPLLRLLDRERVAVDDALARGVWPPPIARNLDLAAAHRHLTGGTAAPPGAERELRHGSESGARAILTRPCVRRQSLDPPPPMREPPP